MKNLLVSFSGGETSAFMSQWIKKHLEDQYDKVVYVFANTGAENEETLEFVERCDNYFGLNVQWVEASVSLDERKGTSYWLTDFDNAKRNGEPFEQVIKKYGIPNQAYPHCTRELKLAPINSFGKEWFDGEPYDTAIGIRSDEFDRMNENYKELRLIYPLIHKNMIPTSKVMVNFFWQQMDFRLNLKGYEGNCKWCWKKSKPKLVRIAIDNPERFDFPKQMEEKYGRYFPERRIEKWNKEGKEMPDKVTFFRGNESAKDILSIAKIANPRVIDDSIATREKGSECYQQSFFDELDNYDLVGGESCEVWSSCGE